MGHMYMIVDESDHSVSRCWYDSVCNVFQADQLTEEQIAGKNTYNNLAFLLYLQIYTLLRVEHWTGCLFFIYEIRINGL